jgi:hypothetical protein
MKEKIEHPNTNPNPSRKDPFGIDSDGIQTYRGRRTQSGKDRSKATADRKARTRSPLERTGRMTEEYNGWKNYETWNVALYLDNDEGTYLAVKEYVKDTLNSTDDLSYDGLIEYLGIENESTPDGIPWSYFRIDRKEMFDWLMDHAESEEQEQYRGTWFKW